MEAALRCVVLGARHVQANECSFSVVSEQGFAVGSTLFHAGKLTGRATPQENLRRILTSEAGFIAVPVWSRVRHHSYPLIGCRNSRSLTVFGLLLGGTLAVTAMTQVCVFKQSQK